MNTIRASLEIPTRRCDMVCFCLLIFSTFSINICCSKPSTNAEHLVATAGKTSGKTAAKKGEKKGSKVYSATSSENASDMVPHLSDWREVSLKADKLIDQKKFADAESILIRILPHAKSEAPESVDYALTLCRLSTDFYLLKKYPPALERANEAVEILSHKRPSLRQRQVTWRVMVTKTAILLAIGNNAEAEGLARKAIAYAIAFPDAAPNGKLKIAYSLLNDSLVKQQKVGEAKKVSEIMNSL